jgi:phosphatidylglycerol lysyltransferase
VGTVTADAVRGAAAGTRARLIDVLDRRGASPLSFLLRYDAPWQAYFQGDGAVAYLEACKAAVAWSDPLCDDADLPGVVRGFDEAMRRERRGVCLVAVSLATAQVALAAGYSVLKVGEEPWFDLATWARARGDRGKKLRWLLNHAGAGGVEVTERGPAPTHDPDFVRDVETVVGRWRASLGRPESNSFMRAAPLELPELKRLFVAHRGGAAEAVLSCAYLPATGAWYFEDLVRTPDALNGATELLVVTALERLRAAGAPAAAFALAPMRGMRDQIDGRARWLGWVLEGAIRRMDRRYGFHAIARYEARFTPSEWRPRYVAFKPALPRPAVVRAALRALGTS